MRTFDKVLICAGVAALGFAFMAPRLFFNRVSSGMPKLSGPIPVKVHSAASRTASEIEIRLKLTNQLNEETGELRLVNMTAAGQKLGDVTVQPIPTAKTKTLTFRIRDLPGNDFLWVSYEVQWKSSSAPDRSHSEAMSEHLRILD